MWFVEGVMEIGRNTELLFNMLKWGDKRRVRRRFKVLRVYIQEGLAAAMRIAVYFAAAVAVRL
jgi:hypothetical protein